MRVGLIYSLTGPHIVLKDEMNDSNWLLNYLNTNSLHSRRIETIILHAFYCEYLHK